MLRLLSVAVFLLSGISATACWAQNPPNEAELKRLQSAIQKVKSELAANRNQRSEVAGQLQQNEQAILKLQQSIGAITQRIETTTAELSELQQQAQVLEQQRKAQQSHVSDYLLNARIAGSDTALKLLLNQDDPMLSSRMLQYYRYLSSARAERIQAYRSTLASLDEVSTNILATSESLKQEQEEQTQQAAALQQNHAARQNLLAKLDATIDTQGNNLAGLEQQRTEIEQLLKELRSSIVDLNLGDSDIPFAKRKGQLPWPVQGKATNSFGSKHALGDLTWEGINLQAPAGTEIRAIHHGRVLYADWLGSSGLLLIIDHGDGYMSLYAHNQELYKTVGDWVSSGELISTAGNTGGQRDSGLYFEIRRNGKAENPVNWCVARR